MKIKKYVTMIDYDDTAFGNKISVDFTHIKIVVHSWPGWNVAKRAQQKLKLFRREVTKDI